MTDEAEKKIEKGEKTVNKENRIKEEQIALEKNKKTDKNKEEKIKEETKNSKNDKSEEKKEKPEEKEKKPKEKTIEEKYKDSQEEIKKLKEKQLYLQAEMQNSQKIMLKRMDITRHNAKVDAIKMFLPVVDTFTSVIGRLEKMPEDSTKNQLGSYLDGFKKVQSQFMQILENAGVKPIEKTNVPFNYREHEVLMKLEDDSKDEDTILEIVQKGWYIGDNILKPAKVVVSKKKEIPKPIEAKPESTSEAVDNPQLESKSEQINETQKEISPEQKEITEPTVEKTIDPLKKSINETPEEKSLEKDAEKSKNK